MATSFTLEAIDVFPAGTTVGAYPASGFSGRPSGAPPVSASETQTMGATGAEFTALAEGHYFFGASISGTWRYVEATVTPGDAPVGEYGGASSYQPVGPDLNLAAGAGKSTGTAFLAAVMGNVIGAALTKTKNYLAGLIGHYSLTGTRASTYPAGGVLAGIGDGTTTADGAFVAYIDGDDSTTTAGAAFKVRNNNSTAASGFDFGLDLQDAAHDGFQPVDSAFYLKGAVRLVEDVCLLVGTATPTNGTSGNGAGVAGPGSLHLNTSDGKLRTNTNTKASPTWAIVGSQS